MHQSGDDRRLAGLLRGLSEDAGDALRRQVRRTGAEFGRRASHVAWSLTAALVGALVLFVGVQVLSAGAVFGLARMLPWWLAAVLVGLAVGLCGALVMIAGLRRLRPARRRENETFGRDAKSGGASMGASDG